MLFRSSKISLYPEQIVSGMVDYELNVDDWHHLIVQENTVFTPESVLNLGPNGFVRINRGVKVDVLGTLNAKGEQGSMFSIMSNQGIYQDGYMTLDLTDFYQSFNVLEGAVVFDNTVSWGRFLFGNASLVLNNGDGINIDYSRFYGFAKGFYATNTTNSSVEHSIFTGLSDTISIGINLYMCPDGSIVRNLITVCKTGIHVEEDSHPDVLSNVLVYNGFGIELFNSNSKVQYNYIRKNVTGLRIAGRRSPSVEYNYIDSETGVFIGFNGYYPHATPQIHNNNMISSINYFYV